MLYLEGGEGQTFLAEAKARRGTRYQVPYPVCLASNWLVGRWREAEGRGGVMG